MTNDALLGVDVSNLSLRTTCATPNACWSCLTPNISLVATCSIYGEG